MPQPNRWNTPITVELYTVTSPSTYMSFSDLQLAYIWIKSNELDYPGEWNSVSFEDTCRELDIAYSSNGLRGNYCVAQSFNCQYIVYYGVLTI